MRTRRRPRRGQTFIPILKGLRARDLLGRNRSGQRVFDRDGNAFVCTDEDPNIVHANDRTPKTGDFSDGYSIVPAGGECIRAEGKKVTKDFYDKKFRRSFPNTMYDFMVIQ